MNKPTAFDAALDALRRYIVAHALRPGDALPPVADLARACGVSHATMREALRAWEAAGIVTIRHGVGAFLQRYNWAPIVENLSVSALFEPELAGHMLGLRAILEEGLMPQAVERLTTEDVEELETLCQELLTDDVGLGAEIRFHALLGRAGGNPLAEGLLRLTWLAQQQSTMGRSVAPRLRYALHVELVEAVRARDLWAAQMALRRYFEALARTLPLAHNGGVAGETDGTGSPRMPPGRLP